MRFTSSCSLALVVLSLVACTKNGARPPGTRDAGPTEDLATVGDIRIEPADQVALLTAGTPAVIDYRAYLRQSDGREREITSEVLWQSSVTTLGTFTGSQFTSAADLGGRTNIFARYGSQTGTTTLTLRLERVIVVAGTPPDAATRFGGAADPSLAPEIVYPDDGTVVPPNLQVLEVHFRAPGADLFELAFTATALDLRVYFTCPEVVSGGCIYTPDAAVWDAIATAARGTGPTTYTLRATNGGGGVGASAPREITFTEENITGGLYYWNAGGGSIMRYDFGIRGARPETFLNSASTGSGVCVGCHSLARNGTRISVGLGLIPTTTFQVYDIATRARVFSLTGGGFFPAEPCFSSFSPDATLLATSAATGIDIRDTATGAILTPMIGGAGATHPDWSPLGDRIVVTKSAEPVPGGLIFDPMGVASGSLSELVRDSSGVWTEQPLLARTGTENNFYPAYSPDAQWVVFNRSPSNTNSAGGDPDAGIAGVPDAEIWIVATNRSGLTMRLAAAGGYGDTWVKWDPTSYLDQGRTLFWLTWSSRRAYGLRYAQDAKVQLWMTAFDPAAALTGADPSSPAFRLPFQDIASGNHVGQWVTSVERLPCVDNSVCGPGEFCSGGVCTPDFI